MYMHIKTALPLTQLSEAGAPCLNTDTDNHVVPHNEPLSNHTLAAKQVFQQELGTFLH